MIKFSSQLFGTTYWAQWWSIPRKPAYEIFKYYGHDNTIGLYYFRHVKRNIVITKSFHQLQADPNFRPFLLETKNLNKIYSSNGVEI